MSDPFEIKSVRSDMALVFSGWDGDYFTVELHGGEVSAVRRVWGYTDCQSLVGLLWHLAKQQRGWNDPAIWSSIESDLALEFRSDVVGHVFVHVTMSHRRGVEDWRVSVEIETELGQLPSIAQSATRFFNSQ